MGATYPEAGATRIAEAEEILSRAMLALVDSDHAGALDELSVRASALPSPSRDHVLLTLRRAAVVKEQLTHHKRRELELQTVFETTRYLSSLRDVDEVLAAIVRRVRQLFGADSGYIALVDEETGDAFMRTTSGTVSHAIESVRLRPGQGIGGWIIKNSRPLATSDYLADDSLIHDPSVDEAVRRDGLRSIAGVPIVSREETIGALFIADRHEQIYGGSEIALLTALADQVAIALENARLFQRLQSTADELRHALEELRAQTRRQERASVAHERFLPLALRRVAPQEFCRLAAEIVEGTVAQIDDHGVVVALAAVDAVGKDERQLFLETVRARACVAETPDRAGAERLPSHSSALEMWAVPIAAGDEAFGQLLFAVPGPLDPVMLGTLERAAQTAALLELMDRQTALVEEQLRGDLIHELLADREPSWEDFERRAGRAGLVDFARSQAVFVLSPGEGRSRKQVLRACSAFASNSGGLATEYGGNVIMLLPCDALQHAMRMARQELPRLIGGQVTAGAAGPVTSARGVRELYGEAVRCHRLLLALDRAGSIASIGDLGTIGLILEGTSKQLVQRLVDQRLGALLRYDEEHRTVLVETLETYFAEGQNPRATAGRLHVHANTVYQRLERVDHVLGAAWREPAHTLEVQLALQLHRVVQDLALDGPVASSPA